MNKCANCSIEYAPLRRGMCRSCYRYKMRTGEDRPLGVDLRRYSARRGPASPMWRGDAAVPTAKRHRAQVAYPLDTCERCGAPATDRHHKDRDTGNNARSNLEFLCRRCHMTVDGRLHAFVEHKNPVLPPQPCRNCGKLAKPLRRGLCGACNEYQRRNGSPRPAERTFVPALPCAHCQRPEKPLRRGLCHACYEYQRKRGVPRPL